jgi:hypothetical protein
VRPDASYARDGDVHIAYQAVQGSGSRDLLLVPEFWHSIELDEAGMFTLRGVPGEWRLFSVADRP